MICYYFRERYQSVTEVLKDLDSSNIITPFFLIIKTGNLLPHYANHTSSMNCICQIHS